MYLINIYMLITLAVFLLLYLLYSVYKMIKYEAEVQENYRKFKEKHKRE